jgi:cathepsin L
MFFLVALASARLTVLDEERRFVEWMRQTNIFYTGEEYQLRFGIFIANARYVEEFNRGRNSFTVELNKFASYTPAEYKSMLGYRPARKEVVGGSRPEKTTGAPDAVDWRTSGAVNAIKDQGQCGSCWAFGVIQSCESINFIKSKVLYSFSESDLVDCCYLSMGCNGGNPVMAFFWIGVFQGGKFNLEKDYPYKPQSGSCKYDSSKAVGYISGWTQGTPVDEAELKENIANLGPACIAIDASQTSFQLYKTGIYTDGQCSSIMLDHAVGCIGYGAEGANLYWLVRNSWGVTWGEKGYIRIAREKGNMCGVSSEPTWAKP